jgi:membrane protease YdiL (CAAX protease family)
LPLIVILTVVAALMLLAPMLIVDQILNPGVEPPGGALLNNPLLEVAALLLSVAVILPAVWMGVRAAEGRSLGWVSSVVGRLRWRWLALTALPIGALVVLGYVAFIVVGSLLEPNPGEVESAPVQWGLLLGGLALIIVLVPVQAAAEEYFFRGFLMQMIGGYLRSPWFGVAITSVLFALAHVDFQWTRLLSLTAFGVVAAVLTLYTGGLEAGIVLHTVNNLLAFGLTAVADAPTSDVSDTIMPWWMMAVDLAMLAAVLAVVLWLARRRRVPSTVPAVG